ncbi:MAG: hypothetical protein JNN15_11065 [Blastocatellia bacterium]|nr:hypothetical protein [Blastocatellia bacterium]
MNNTLDICREFYNAYLQERRDAYRLQNLSLIKIKLSNYQQSKEVEQMLSAAKNILARGIDLLQAEGLSVSAPEGSALAGLLKGEPWDISMLPSSLVPQTVASS